MAATAQSPRVVIERQGPVARVWLDRPEARNAMDPQALKEIVTGMKALGKDPTVRVAVIGGKGPDFCAGADIAWMRKVCDFTPAQNEKDARLLIDMCRAVDEAPFAVIARIHGNCFGGGLGVVAACDIAVAETGARFCFSETRIGIIPAVVSTFVLPKIGAGQARKLYMTAEVFGAEQAKQVGLIQEVAAQGALDAEVNRLANLVLQNSPAAVRASKEYVRALEPLPKAKRVPLSAKMLAKVRSGPEAKEGLSAFLEKRKASWAQKIG